VHKLKELVDHRLEEFPMGSEKTRILANNIHDIACDDGLVVLAPFHLDHAKQVLDHVDDKLFLLKLSHGTTDGTDGPAQRVEILP